MFNFLKRKQKESDGTESVLACNKSSNRQPVEMRRGNGKTQSEKFRERYKGVDLFNRTDRSTTVQPNKQMKGRLNSTKKSHHSTTLHSLEDLDVLCN